MTRPAVLLAVLAQLAVPALLPVARAEPAGTHADEAPIATAPAGFAVEVFAAAPDIHSPASLAVASPRVVFIGEDDYNTGGTGGRVLRCEDTDGDHRADRFTVFASGLNAPQGMTFVHDTLYVVHAPLLTAFRDQDGDGVADVRDDLVIGLGPAPKDLVHHIPSGIRLGVDGWLAISIGDKGIERAVGKDGSTVRLEGGGVVRVRLDGTELELVASGLRNTFDVATDPRLDYFTRDNTNDGDGWNARLSHIQLGAEYGYPRLFKNFAEEIIPALADYGGGSATGSLWLREIGWPCEFDDQLYTCDWGRGLVYRHVMAPDGATFRPDQEEFLACGNPTDLDADGAGALFVADWARGGWSESPPCGRIYRVSVAGVSSPPRPDTRQAGDAELLGELSGPSQVRLLEAQRALIERGARCVPALEALARARGPACTRVAALFAMKEILGAGAQPLLESLLADPDLREHALRALADRRTQLASVRAEPFLAALADADPRVRVQAAIGLGRLGRAACAGALVPLTADRDRMVRHAAMRSLRTLGASEACLDALTSEDPAIAAGALRTLRELHSTATITGLIAALERAPSRERRQDIVRTLARLDLREGEWDGSWWDTRPDTRGPHFRPVAWQESARIDGVLAALLERGDPAEQRLLIEEMGRYRLAASAAPLARVACGGSELAASAARALVTIDAPACAPALEHVALDARFEPDLRAAAVQALMRLPQSCSADLLMNVGEQVGGSESAPTALRDEALTALRSLIEPAAAPRMAALVERSPARVRQAAYTALLQMPCDEARASVERGWQDESRLLTLLPAIGHVQAKEHTPRVCAELASGSAAVQRAALVTLGDLRDPAAVESVLPFVDRAASRSLALRALGLIGPTGDAAEITRLATLMVTQAEALAVGADPCNGDDVAHAARAFCADARLEPARARELSARLSQLSGVLACYDLLGPLPDEDRKGLDLELSPERDPEAVAPFAWQDRSWTWQPVFTADDQGRVWLHEISHTSAPAVALLRSVYEAHEPGPAEMLVGSDDGVRIYLNGELVHENRAARSLTPAQDRVAIQLREGKNFLLCKVANEGGDHGLSVKIEEARRALAALDPEAVIEDALTRPGDATLGAQLFVELSCTKCHAVARDETPKGPFLGDAGDRLNRRALIESVLRPSAQIAQGFQPQTFALQDGSELDGFVVAEASDRIDVRDASGTLTVLPKASIKARNPRELSIMPQGLADRLDRDQFAALIAYLTSLRYRNPEQPAAQ